jgi:hypothetical protein
MRPQPSWIAVAQPRRSRTIPPQSAPMAAVSSVSHLIAVCSIGCFPLSYTCRLNDAAKKAEHATR